MAFKMCRSLTRVTFSINSKLRRIGYSSFEQSSITAIDIPQSVEVIDDGAFEDRLLKEIVFHTDSKLKRIGEALFKSLLITEIYVPSLVEISV